MFRFLVFTSFLLTAALIFHAAHLEHHHPLEFGDGIQAILHGEDRKWLFALLLAALVAAALLLSPQLLIEGTFRGSLHAPYRLEHNFLRNLVDPIRRALRTGIVHPKLCD